MEEDRRKEGSHDHEWGGRVMVMSDGWGGRVMVTSDRWGGRVMVMSDRWGRRVMSDGWEGGDGDR